MTETALHHSFQKIYIHESSKNSEVAQRILETTPPGKVEWVSEEPLPEVRGNLTSTEFSQSKKLLYLTEFQGQFFKRCPGVRPGLTCCNYFVLNLGQQCPMNCSYCYLQSYINSPLTSIYTNIDQALSELEIIADQQKDKAFRVGTGEIIDSLSLDRWTMYTKKLIGFFSNYPKWKLELKTKSNFVDQFIDEPHAGNVIVSWSVNPNHIIENEEHLTASLNERLAAARKCLNRDFIVALHIDPVIWHPQWKENYSQLIKTITEQFTPEEIPYISLGALRFQPEQRHMMRERFGMKSWTTRAEMFPSPDGKLRYDQDLRSEMFKFIIDTFKANHSRWKVYLCMESPESWIQSVQQMPIHLEGISEHFDHRIIRGYKETSP